MCWLPASGNAGEQVDGVVAGCNVCVGVRAGVEVVGEFVEVRGGACGGDSGVACFACLLRCFPFWDEV